MLGTRELSCFKFYVHSKKATCVPLFILFKMSFIRNHGAIDAVANELGRPRSGDDSLDYGSTTRRYLPMSISTVGVVLGVGAFFSGLHIHSVHTGLWGFSSGAFAAFCLHLAILNRMGLVEKWYTPQILCSIVKLGVVVQICGLLGTIVYIIIEVSEHHRHHGLRIEFYLTVAFALLTSAWGLYLSFYAWRLKVFMERRQASLIHGVRAYPDA